MAYRMDITFHGFVLESVEVDATKTAEDYAHDWVESTYEGETKIVKSDGIIPNGCANYRLAIFELFPKEQDDEIDSESEVDYYDFFLE